MKGKRIFSSIITAIIIAGTFGTSIMAEIKAYSSETMATAVKAHQLDVDGDGKLSIADAVALMRFVAEDRNAKVKNVYDADGDQNQEHQQNRLNCVNLHPLLLLLSPRPAKPHPVFGSLSRRDVQSCTPISSKYANRSGCR